VTTQIYQPFTGFDVERVAHKFGVHRTAVGGNPSAQKTIDGRSLETYLTEVIKTLRAMADYAIELA
jgi:hypothetical protein